MPSTLTDSTLLGKQAPRWIGFRSRTAGRLRTACWLLLVLAVPAAGQEGRPGDAPAGPIADYEALRRTKIYRAARATGPIVVDGSVDEPAWALAEVGGGFYQSEPHVGMPASEETEFRILYDEANIYVAIVSHQSGPLIVSGLQRDFTPRNGDQVGVLFDTFDDDRNGFLFYTNPGGAQRDQQIAGGIVDANWDGAFRNAVRVHDPGAPPGWSAEFAIPFKTLRFDGARAVQRWGLNFLRISRARNEWTLWSPGPRPYGVLDVFLAGALEGIEGVRQGRNLHVKPFLTASLRPDALPGGPQRREADLGLDLKLGVTASVTLDLTLNTDFSHVEADEQQVNLTRFSLFFPEKREFFLENSGLFDVGGGRGGVGTGPGLSGFSSRNELVPFFSRRIGLSPRNEPLPIRGGARVTGKLGGLDIGVLNLLSGAQGDVPADGRTVVRVKRNFLADSDAGAFLFHRDVDSPSGDNTVAGLDLGLRLLRRRLTLAGFALRSHGAGDGGDGLAGRVESSYADNFWALKLSHVTIAEDFRNDFGFVPRPAIRQLAAFAAVRPRPRSGALAELIPQAEARYVTDHQDRLLTGTQRTGLWLNFRDASYINVFYRHTFERLDGQFLIHPGISIPPGDYDFASWELGFSTSLGRPLFASGGLQTGTFWSGSLRELRLSSGLRPSAHFAAQVSWSRNLVHLAEGDFRTDLVALRLAAAYSPRMFLEGFIQYNTDARTVSSRIRYRLIHRPLSDLFLVYDEVRGMQGNDELARVFSFKFTRLVSF